MKNSPFYERHINCNAQSVPMHWFAVLSSLFILISIFSFLGCPFISFWKVAPTRWPRNAHKESPLGLRAFRLPPHVRALHPKLSAPSTSFPDAACAPFTLCSSFFTQPSTLKETTDHVANRRSPTRVSQAKANSWLNPSLPNLHTVLNLAFATQHPNCSCKISWALATASSHRVGLLFVMKYWEWENAPEFNKSNTLRLPGICGTFTKRLGIPCIKLSFQPQPVE